MPRDNAKAVSRGRGKASRDFQKSRLAFLFLAPLLILLIVFMLLPVVTGVRMSFLDEFGNPVGLENYRVVLSEARFGKNIQLSLTYVVCNVSLSIILGFLAANLITDKSKIVSVLRPIYLIPWIIPPVASSVLFRTMLDANTGPVTRLIKLVTGSSIMILDKPNSAMVAVIIHNFWRSFPFAMLFLAAGLTMISKDVYEAATIDGATGWQQFTRITLPLVKNHLFIVTLMITNWTLQDSESVYSLTKGGPGTATEMVAVRLFKDSFVYFDVNTGAVIGIVMLAIAGVFAVIYTFLMRAREAEAYE